MMNNQGPPGHGPPHKKPRGDFDYHKGGPGPRFGGGGGHGPGYDDYPNLREFLERKDEKLPPNHILLITVLNAKFPINVEVMYKVCTIVGAIKRIVCFERNTVVQVNRKVKVVFVHMDNERIQTIMNSISILGYGRV